MSWYRGRYVTSKRTLAQWMADSKKDYHISEYEIKTKQIPQSLVSYSLTTSKRLGAYMLLVGLFIITI